MPTKKRARSAIDKEAQFNVILNMGEKLLQENDGRSFSIRELARRLDMAPSNLYNYVKNEDALRVAILHEHFRMSSTDLEQMEEISGKTYIERLEKLITHYFESSINEHSWVAIELARLQSLGEKHPLDIGIMISPFRHLIERAIDTGEIPKEDANLLALFVWSLVQGSVSMLRLAELGKMLDEGKKGQYIKYVTNLAILFLKSSSLDNIDLL